MSLSNPISQYLYCMIKFQIMASSIDILQFQGFLKSGTSSHQPQLFLQYRGCSHSNKF